jgi:hypothetical protein
MLQFETMATFSHILKDILSSEFGTQEKASQATGVNRTTLAQDVTERRPVSDDRFHKYLKSVSPSSQTKLIKARILDMLPQEYHDLVMTSAESSRLSESDLIFSGNSPWSNDVRSCLTWLGENMSTDPEVETFVFYLCKQMGWRHRRR